MKALLVARKNLIEILRELQLLLLELALPLVFLGITAAFYSIPLLATHPILVSSSDSRGAPLIEALESQRYADGRPVFDVTPITDREAAEAALKDRSAVALIAVSPHNSENVQEEHAQGLPLRVTIQGDAIYSRFHRVSTIQRNLINQYALRLTNQPEVVRVSTQPLVPTDASAAVRSGPQTEFDLYAPGMMIMALLMLIPQTAMLVAREIRWKTLRRLRLTRLGAADLLAGVSLAQFVVAVLQIVVMFVAALAMGFNNQGSLWLAIVVGLVVSFSAIGQGLIVACFVENDSQAANVGSTFTMLQVFVSGSFYQLPPLTLFTMAGHQIDLFDVFPATHGFMALQQVLSYGFGVREIAFRLLATLVLSLLYFSAGVIIFQRLQMRNRT